MNIYRYLHFSISTKTSQIKATQSQSKLNFGTLLATRLCAFAIFNSFFACSWRNWTPAEPQAEHIEWERKADGNLIRDRLQVETSKVTAQLNDITAVLIRQQKQQQQQKQHLNSTVSTAVERTTTEAGNNSFLSEAQLILCRLLSSLPAHT